MTLLRDAVLQEWVKKKKPLQKGQNYHKLNLENLILQQRRKLKQLQKKTDDISEQDHDGEDVLDINAEDNDFQLEEEGEVCNDIPDQGAEHQNSSRATVPQNLVDINDLEELLVYRDGLFKQVQQWQAELKSCKGE